MTFAVWCAEPLLDGHHRFDSLPLPPMHPLMHGQFVLEATVSGGRIAECYFDATGSHRGDEELLRIRDFKQGLALINRHGWLTSSFAETLYARLIERALGIVVSDRTAALRELALSLNAAAADEFWRVVDAEVCGESASLALRESLLDVFERLTGARMHATYVRIGGVSADIDDDDVAGIRALGITEVDTALDRVLHSTGAIAVQLPKVVRLPQGEYADSISTPHGTLSMTVISTGDKRPTGVHLRTAGSAALAELMHAATGMTTRDFFLRLAKTRFVLGEIAL